MERNCNSCERKNECSEYKDLGEEQRDRMSCEKYSPMDLVEYVIYIKDKHSSYMIDTSSVSKYFKF